MLACVVGVVMLILCANLSNLQLARLSARHKELAIRTALGAARSRLLRQLLTESVALSCCGAVFGLILAATGARVIAHVNTLNLPLLETVQIGGRGLAFTLLAAVATGVLFECKRLEFEWRSARRQVTSKAVSCYGHLG